MKSSKKKPSRKVPTPPKALPKIKRLELKLAAKEDELKAANDRLHAALEEPESVSDIPALFLDDKLRIANFTPAMNRLVKLTKSDISRQVDQFSDVCLGKDLVPDAKKILAAAGPLSTEVQCRGKWYLRLMFPWRSQGTKISGVTVSYTDITERKNSETQLREQEVKFRGIFENNNDAIVLLDVAGGRYVDCNQVTHTMSGYSREEILAMRTGGFLSPPHKDEVASNMETIKSGGVLRGETEMIHKNGTLIPVEFNASMVTIGKQQFVMSVIRDITGRKKAEKELLFRSHLLANVHDAVIGLDAEFVIHYWNKSAELLYGWTAEEAIGRRSVELFQSEFPNSTTEENASRLKNAGRGEFEAVHRTKDGRTLFVDVHSAMIPDASGNPTGYISTCRDLTERKRMEAEIRLLAKFPSENPNPILRVSKDGWVLYANDASGPLMKMWGCGAGCEIPQPVRQQIVDAFTAETQGTIEIECEKRFYSFAVVPVSEPGYVNLYGRDITVRMMVEEALRESEQRLKFHFENSPLAVVEWDVDYIVTQWSKEAETIFGWSKEEVLGKRIDALNMIYADDIPIVNRTMERLSSGKERTVVSSNRNYTKSGAVIECTWYNSVLSGDKGQMTSVMSLVLDITDRKKAEEALRFSEEKYRHLFNSLIEGFCIIEMVFDDAGKPVDYRFLEINEAFEAQTGLHEAQGKLMRDLAPDHEEHWFQIYGQIAMTGKPASFVNEARALNRWYDVNAFRVGGEESRKVAICFSDITERKKAEQEIVRASEALKLAHDELEQRVAERTAGQLVTNRILEQFARTSSKRVFLDAAVHIIREWSACEFVGVRVRDHQGNIPFESHVGFDEEFLALENTLHVDRDNCICIRAIVERVQEQERKFVSPGGSFSINDSGEFLNGLSSNERGEYRGACMDRGFRSLAVVPIRFNNQVFGAIHLADHASGMAPPQTVHFLEETIAPLVGEALQRFNAEAELEAHHLHVEELVDQRTKELLTANDALKREMQWREKLSMDLVRSNNDLEQFAYVASHDLQEPLRAVSGFVELLKRHLSGTLDEKRTEYFNFIVDGVGRMQSLINGLLEYSRIGTRGKAPELTAIKDAFDHALLNLQRSVEESGAQVVAGELPSVLMDHLQLQQLFQNLIGNAIKFRSPGTPPRITVSAERGDGEWLIAVRDNGIGIDPQFAQRIFLIFQRLHTRAEYPGTGIGLAVCKKIVERHGGRIWVESNPGAGAAFFFTIPDKGDPQR
jgi:PAS domain S-box-containing protein